MKTFQRFCDGKCESISRAGDVLDDPNHKYEVLNRFEAPTKEEARRLALEKEGWYIRNFPCLNKKREMLTEDDKREYIIKWKQDHPNYFKEYQKKWKENHPEYNKEYLRKWRQDNPDYFKKYHDKGKEKVACSICNKQVSNNYLSKHMERIHQK